MTVTWGAVCRAKQGQSVSGDVYVIREHGDQYLTVSVIDGLGGGIEAERAARIAAQLVESNIELSISDLIRRSHTALHSTRGAVMSVLRFDIAHHKATYVGVGNIGAYVYSRQPIKPISKNGILGFRMPNLLELSYVYDPGDIFVLYSDGISSQFALNGRVDIHQPAQQIAEQLLSTYGKHNDDATIVVVKT